MWAIVPLKSPEHAKSRLMSVLQPTARRELFYSLARHVIETLQSCSGISRVAVVTASDAAGAFASYCGAEVIRQDSDLGTSAAFAHGIAHLNAGKHEAVLMMAGDLPLVSVKSIENLLAARATAPAVVIAPDLRQTGTNALLCTPPDIMSLHFGSGSFQKHCMAARDCGASLRVVRSAELGLDIDVSEDLKYLREATQSLPMPTPLVDLMREPLLSGTSR